MIRFRLLERPFLHKNKCGRLNDSEQSKYKVKIDFNKNFKLLCFFIFSLSTLLISSNVFAQTYCTPSYSWDCSSNDLISQVELQGETVNINNSTGCSTNGYGDYTSLPAADLGMGGTYEITISTSYSSPSWENVAAWIDYNDNGIFESSELLGYDPNGMVGGSNTYTFTVPAGLTPGNYRLRVRLAYNQTNGIDPCTSYSYGETEDYMVNIFQFADCSAAVAGTISSNLASVCADDTYILSSTGATGAGNGLTFQWQSSPAGANTWTNVPNGNSLNVSLTGLVADTDYRLVVNCSFGNLEDTSNVITVNANPITSCYCEPIYTSGDYTSAFSTSNAIDNVTFSTSTTYNYNDLSGTDTITAYAGVNFDIDHTYVGGSNTVVVWVDFNEDGIFDDATEKVYQHYTSSASQTGSIFIPFNTPPGNYRLRLRSRYSTTVPTPCSSETWGSALDYTLRVEELPDCDEAMAGIITSDYLTVCEDDTYTLSTTGNTGIANGLTYLWQSSPTGANTWTDVPNSFNTSISLTGLTDATDYRFIVTCSFGNLEDTSNVITVGITPSNQCYCEPIYTSGEYTANFTTIGAIENVNVTHTAVYNYIDYSNTDTITQMAGLDLNLEHTYNLSSHSAVIWVDWNQNGEFEANELVYHGNTSSNPLVGSFNIPPTITPGNYRLRLRSYWSTVSNPQPCNSSTWGSGTDFTLRVIPMPECDEVATPSHWHIYSNLDSICENGDIRLTISESIIANDVSYIFQSSTNGTNWTNLNTGSLDLTIDIDNLDVTTQFRAIWLCDGVIVDSTDAITVLVAGAPSLLTVEDGQNCGVGQVTLNATASAGAQVAWYDDINSAAPIHVGNSFTTPVIGADQTYYVSAFVGSAGSPDVFIGSGNTTTTSTPQPFHTLYWGNKNQYLIRASELLDAGYTPGLITEVIFDVVAAGGMAMDNFTIKIGNTTNNATTSTYDQTLTTVYTSTAPEVLQANSEKVFVLNNPFVWDGSSNIIIETCFNNSTWSSGHSVRTTNVGFNASTYNSGDNTNVCSATTGSTSQVRPNIKLTIDGACRSPKEEVHALIRPDVNLNIATNQNLCVSSEHPGQLDAGAHPNNVTYLWDNGATGRFREVLQSGTYNVTVTNEFGCSASADINVTIRQNPEVDLGPDTTLCLGGAIQLDAGPDGATYSWSNGITTRYNEITTPGTYTVLVAAGNGCIVLDTIEITFSNYEIASFDGIQVENMGMNSFKFQALNPQNVTDYLWIFGDGNTSTEQTPTYTYPNNGNYVVVLEASNDCGTVSDSISTHIISIGERDNNDLLTVYPNPTNGKVYIKNTSSSPINQITINDGLGRKLQTINVEINDQNNNMEIDLSIFADGVYWLNIHTDKKVYNKKINLIR